MTLLRDQLERGRWLAEVWDGSDYDAAPWDAALSDLAAIEQARDEARRESDWQMSSKLDAQMALMAITKALDLELAAMGEGWKEGVMHILVRIESIVDEAERGFRGRDRAVQALSRLRGWVADECPYETKAEMVALADAALAAVGGVSPPSATEAAQRPTPKEGAVG